MQLWGESLGAFHGLALLIEGVGVDGERLDFSIREHGEISTEKEPSDASAV